MKTAKDAKRANIAKTDFLRRMRHDIRTPINGIRGLVEIGDHFPEDVEKQKECRSKIRDASGYLLEADEIVEVQGSNRDFQKFCTGNL